MNIDYVTYVCSIGASMIENGAEISRAEDSVRRMLYSKGYRHCSVFCLNSIIIVYTESGCSIKRIYKNDLNLYEIEKLNSVSRCICENREYIESENTYPLLVELLSVIVATGSFCLYFGGTLLDAIFCGIIGIVINYLPQISKTIFPRTLCQSLLAGMLSFAPSYIGLYTHSDKIMIGAIMLLVPGITIGCAIRDIMYSDTLSGVIELTESVFLALAISLGYYVAVLIFAN